MNTQEMTGYVVRATDGSVDKAATLAKFSGELDAFVSETTEELSNISAAVNSVFDQYRGERIVLPTLADFAAQKLNAQPHNMQSLKDKIQSYVRSNTVAFDIARGKGGGVARRSDLTQTA